MAYHGLHDLAQAYLFFLILPPFLYHVLATGFCPSLEQARAVFLS